MYTIHHIPGSQYLEYNGPWNILLALYSLVFSGYLRTGSRVDDPTSNKNEHGLFAPTCYRLYCRETHDTIEVYLFLEKMFSE